MHKVYPTSDHHFPIDQVDPDALYVIEKLQKAGYVAYLVGGSVRDILLKKTPKDFDISTSARPEEVRKLFRNCILIGRRFRLAHIRFGKKIIEVSTFRSGDIASEDLIVRDNEWGTPEEDATRRDFTINGLFFDSSKELIIDYVGGFPDLQKGILRAIGQPYLRFKQDPVRMIRLLKFQARFGFDIEENSKIALAECRSEIAKSASARVLEEILRMLESGSSKPFFELVAHHGLFQPVFPALSEFLESPRGEEIYDYLEEVDSTFQLPGASTLDRSVLLACIVFPCFEERIQKHFLDRGKIPHLGEIQQIALSLVDELFPQHFRLPRKMKWTLVSILNSQYRVTPLDKKKSHPPRLPRDPDFPLALKFFEIRATLEPSLQIALKEWCELPQRSGKHVVRRRRRRPKKKSST